MVEAPRLDGITLDLLGDTLRGVKSVNRSTNKRTIPSLLSYISNGVLPTTKNLWGQHMRIYTLMLRF